MDKQDQHLAYLLGRISVLEVTLLCMLSEYSPEDRASFKRSIQKYLTTAEGLSLFDAVSDDERETFQRGREQAFRAIFDEPEPES